MASEDKPQSKNKTKDRYAPTLPAADIHGTKELPSVLVEGYSLQLRGGEGFLGDQASQTAFRELLERWRQRHRRKGKKDPLGERHSKELAKGMLDAALKEGKASEATDVVHAAIEEFAEALARVIQSFLGQPSWKGVERIVIGGGFPESDVGERAVLQAAAILQEMKVPVELARICHEPDDGGLLGWLHLTPPELLEHYDAILALDIGGTNVRCGIVRTRRKRAPDLSKAKVVRREKWRHADDGPNRRALVARLAEMLEEQVHYCKKKGIRLAPFVGIGCPGLIRKDGSIARGAQNMPGDWTSEHFHLPTELAKKIPTIRGVPTMVLMHNDAVVQGLSELPFMRDVKRWAVLTIGTGLGNASYSNLESSKKSKASQRSS
jgi:predicted NBD/HSP70 family sugar kinase